MTSRLSPHATKRTHTVPACCPRLPSTVIQPEQRLEIVVDEYTPTVPTNFPSNLTLIFTHGTSFNRYFWVPIVESLFRRGLPIRRVLAMDSVNHGDSLELNREKVTGSTHWPDQSRDILEVLRYFQVAQPMIGIGHSFGGGIMSHAAIMAPEAFFATIFIDPILFSMEEQTKRIAAGAMRRKDSWEDLDDVERAFAKNRGLSDWTKEQLRCYAVCGTIERREGSRRWRTLKTSKEQEAATYLAAPFPQLPELLAKSQGLHYFVLGGKSFVINQSDRQWIQKISKSPGEVVILPEAGHLIPMTHPILLSNTVSTILNKICVTLRKGDLNRPTWSIL